MERESLPEGGSGVTSGSVVDVSELGDGIKKSAPHYFIRDPLADERNARQREYRKKNRERLLAIERASRARNKDLKREAEYAKEWRRNNAEKYALTRKEWAEKNREKLRIKTNEYYANNKERRAAQSKMYRERDAEALKARRLANYAAKKDEINARCAQWWKDHPEKLKEKNEKYLSRRRELSKIRRADPVQRLKDSSRTRTRLALSLAGIPKHDHTFDLIGCTPTEFKAYIESKFEPWMNWDNYGEWEVDHIVALSKFDLSDREQLLKAFHYTNCQPLKQFDNRSKCDRDDWVKPS